MDKKSTAVVSFLKKVKFNAVACATLFAMFALTMSASAVPTDIPVEVPDMNFAKVATDLLDQVVPGILAAIGLGLSIWGISFIYRKFKAMGR